MRKHGECAKNVVLFKVSHPSNFEAPQLRGRCVIRVHCCGSTRMYALFENSKVGCRSQLSSLWRAIATRIVAMAKECPSGSNDVRMFLIHIVRKSKFATDGSASETLHWLRWTESVMKASAALRDIANTGSTICKIICWLIEKIWMVLNGKRS